MSQPLTKEELKSIGVDDINFIISSCKFYDGLYWMYRACFFYYIGVGREPVFWKPEMRDMFDNAVEIWRGRREQLSVQSSI